MRTLNIFTLTTFMALFSAQAQQSANHNYVAPAVKFPTNTAIMVDAQTGQRIVGGTDSNSVVTIVKQTVQSSTNVQAWASLTVSNASGGGRTLLTSSNVVAAQFVGDGSLLTGISSSYFGIITTNSATNYVNAFLPFTNGGAVFYIPLMRAIAGGSALALTNGSGTGGGGGGSDPGSGILWAKFDQTSGSTTADSSVQNNTGVIINGDGLWFAGQFGNFYSSPGNGIVKFPHISAYNFGTSDFSASVWVQFTDATGFKDILQLNDSLNSGSGMTVLRVGATIRCATADGSVDCAAPTDNTWHNYILVRSGTSNTVYMDGATIGTFSGNSSTPSSPSSALVSVGGATDSSVLFTGGIDDVRISATAWTSANIAWLQTNP